MKFNNIKKISFELIQIIMGNFCLAYAYAAFILPGNILSGGLGGLGTALKPLIGIEVALFVTIMTWFLFFIGLILLGKKFAATTFLSSILYPLFLNLLLEFNVALNIESDIIRSIYGGLFIGLGIGLVFRVGSSTGGLDIPCLLMEKYLHIKIQIAVLIVDGVILLLGLYNYGTNAVLVGLLTVFVSSYAVEKVMLFGSFKSLELFIISEKHSLIEKAIMKEIDRGVTRIKATGAYTNSEKTILMAIINRKEYPKLLEIVNEIDPNVFISIADVNEVVGNYRR